MFGKHLDTKQLYVNKVVFDLSLDFSERGEHDCSIGIQHLICHFGESFGRVI